MADESMKAERALAQNDMLAIIIVVEGGCVVEVKNLPDAWHYEIDDRDIDDDDDTAAGP